MRDHRVRRTINETHQIGSAVARIRAREARSTHQSCDCRRQRLFSADC
jgi:hypothetical protein